MTKKIKIGLTLFTGLMVLLGTGLFFTLHWPVPADGFIAEDVYQGVPHVVIYDEKKDYMDQVASPLSQMVRSPLTISSGNVQIDIDREKSDANHGRYTFHIRAYGCHKIIDDFDYQGEDDVVIDRGAKWFIMIRK